MPEHTGSTPLQPAIRLGRIGELRIHQITDSELKDLTKGGIDSTCLNLCLFCLSAFISFLITITTNLIQPDWKFCVFTIITCATGLAGGILFVFWLVLWCSERRRKKQVVKTIQDRMVPAEGTQEPLPVDSTDGDRK